MTTGYELDDALRTLTKRVQTLELSVARNKPASGVTFTDDGGFFGGGFPTLQDILDAIGGGTLPGSFLTTIGGGKGIPFDLDPMGSAVTADWANGNLAYGELTEACTITTTGWTNGRDCWTALELTGGASGPHLPTIAGVTWKTAAPTAVATGDVSHILLHSRDGGTTIWGWVADGGETPTDGLVPYLIESGETYTVPVKKQALFNMPITVDAGGSLVVDGFLLMVT